MTRFAALLALLIALPAAACPPVAVRTVAPVVHHVAPVVVAPVVATAVVVPLYSISYAPSPAAAAPDQSALLAELKALRAEVAKLREADPPAATPPATQATPPTTGKGRDLTALLTTCAQCHSPGRTAADKGGAFELFTSDGKTAELTLAQKAKARKLVESSQMPPPKTGSLTPDERKSLADYLDPK